MLFSSRQFVCILQMYDQITLIAQHLEGARAFLKTAPLVPSIPAITHHIDMAVKLTANVEKELSAKEHECSRLKGLLKAHKPSTSQPTPSAATPVKNVSSVCTCFTLQYMACPGGAAVRRQSRDRKVAGLTCGRGAIESTQLSLPSLQDR